MHILPIFFLSIFQNVSIAVVGKNEKFHILNDEENTIYVSAVETRVAPVKVKPEPRNFDTPPPIIPQPGPDDDPDDIFDDRPIPQEMDY